MDVGAAARSLLYPPLDFYRGGNRRKGCGCGWLFKVFRGPANRKTFGYRSIPLGSTGSSYLLHLTSSRLQDYPNTDRRCPKRESGSKRYGEAPQAQSVTVTPTTATTTSIVKTLTTAFIVISLPSVVQRSIIVAALASGQRSSLTGQGRRDRSGREGGEGVLGYRCIMRMMKRFVSA